MGAGFENRGKMVYKVLKHYSEQRREIYGAKYLLSRPHLNHHFQFSLLPVACFFYFQDLEDNRYLQESDHLLSVSS